MNYAELNKLIHERKMEHFRKCYGEGKCLPPEYTNVLMIELGMKEFFDAGFRQGMEFARNENGNAS